MPLLEGDDYTKLGLAVVVLILEGLHAVCYRRVLKKGILQITINFVSHHYHVQEGPGVGLVVSIRAPLPGCCLSSYLDSGAQDGRY